MSLGTLHLKQSELMTQAEVVAYLRQIANSLEAGHIFEGSVEFHPQGLIPDDPNGEGDNITVNAAVRLI